jgi:hypothetical protein
MESGSALHDKTNLACVAVALPGARRPKQQATATSCFLKREAQNAIAALEVIRAARDAVKTSIGTRPNVCFAPQAVHQPQIEIIDERLPLDPSGVGEGILSTPFDFPPAGLTYETEMPLSMLVPTAKQAPLAAATL